MSPKQIFNILLRRLWIVLLAFVSTVTGAYIVYRLLPPRYDAVSTASMDVAQPDPVTGQLGGGAGTAYLQGSLVALAMSNRVALDVVKRLNLASNRDTIADFRASPAFGHMDINQWLAGQILPRMEARFTPGSNILTITYKSPSPNQAALLSNTFMSAFIDAALERKVESAQVTADWFAPQTDKLRTELNTARDRLTEFQRKNKILTPGGGGDSDSTQLMAVTTDLSAAKNELATLQSHLDAWNRGDSITDSSQLSDPDSAALAGLKSQLASTNTEIGKLQAFVGANNPRLTGQVAARKSLQDQIDAEIKNIRTKLESRISQVKTQIASLEQSYADEVQKMISVQEQRDRMSSLNREVEVRQEQFNSALKVAAQARLQSRLSFSNIAVIDPANPPGAPAFPKPVLMIGGGVGLGLALGLILALLAEAFDRRVRCPADLEFASSTHVLGTLNWVVPSRLKRRRRWSLGFFPKRRLPQGQSI